MVSGLLEHHWWATALLLQEHLEVKLLVQGDGPFGPLRGLCNLAAGRCSDLVRLQVNMGERCPSDSGGQTVSFIVDYVPGHRCQWQAS